MIIRIDLAGVRRTKWHDYAIRFLFGGLIAVAAGFIARRLGPSIGGLFLAFPAIFPASATLVEKHEKQKKKQVGLRGVIRGREAAALDAAGGAIGCFGLAGFALIVWQFLLSYQSWVVLSSAGLIWLGVSVLGWKISKVS
jgi:hypothetical protein